jgi:outer membrane protein OmpA-like peptidoglycan-associated protein
VRNRAALCAVAAMVVGSGCATKKYVSREVGEVNQKVTTLSTEVEKTQQRVGKNETRIEEVNSSAQAGVTEAKGTAGQAMDKATEAEKAAKGKLIYTVTLSNDKVTFPVSHHELSDQAKGMIDEALAPYVTENRGVYFEIEGHTDSTGPADYNEKLGEERATAVRNYLHDKHQVALARMEVISYGASKPVSDNKTKAHRAENRRVVIKVLE